MNVGHKLSRCRDLGQLRNLEASFEESDELPGEVITWLLGIDDVTINLSGCYLFVMAALCLPACMI